MGKSIRYLLNFVNKGQYKTVKFQELAVRQFFENIQCPQQFSILQAVAKYLGPDLFNGIYPSFMEYFFSMVFIDNGKPWNLIDAFLKKDYRLLNKEEREYTQLLRNSYMSIYEVLEVTPGKSMLVKNLIEDEAPILVSEKSGTEQIVKWTKLGMRLVHLEDGRTVSGGGLLPMPMEAAEEAIHLIKMKSIIEQEIPGEDFDLLQKKIWVKEIATSWMNHWLTVRSTNVRDLMHNQDGDAIQICKLQFPILGDIEEVAEIIDEMEETDCDPDIEYHWRWIEKATHTQMDILFADVIIQNQKLIVQTNSMERAEALRNIMKAELSDLLGTGLISMENMDKLIENHQASADSKEASISSEAEQKVITKYKQEYYQKWLDMEIPALGDKSPKQAAKTKAGKKALVELFKYMENMELTQAKDTGATAYDFSGLWEELGVADEMRGVNQIN